MVTWLDALSRTRRALSGALSRVFTGASDAGARVDQEALDDLEATLVQADLPARLAAQIVDDLSRSYKGLRVDARDMLRQSLVKALGPAAPFAWVGRSSPLVMLVVGINGSGKTTTCAKLAHAAQRAGRKPLLGAADTFRAAGSDQLRIWAERVGCDAVIGRTGADAAAVAYDAVDAALARGCDTVLIDTAGRMHTKQPLMEELSKVRRAIGKRMADAPHETWIVLDAALGQNALHQARQFHEAAGLTGVVVAKLDGTAKAGFVFSLTGEMKVPVRFVGLGEAMEDLVPFDPAAFVDALLGYESPYKESAGHARPPEGR